MSFGDDKDPVLHDSELSEPTPFVFAPDQLKALQQALLPGLASQIQQVVRQTLVEVSPPATTFSSDFEAPPAPQKPIASGSGFSNPLFAAETELLHGAKSQDYFLSYSAVPCCPDNPHPRPHHAPDQPGLYNCSNDPLLRDIKDKLGVNTAAVHEASYLIPLVSYFHDYQRVHEQHYLQLKAALPEGHPLVKQQAVLVNAFASIFKIAATRHTYLTLRTDTKGTELEGVADAVDLSIQQRSKTGRYLDPELAQEAQDYTQQYLVAKRKELLKSKLVKKDQGGGGGGRGRGKDQGGGRGKGRFLDLAPADGGRGRGRGRGDQRRNNTPQDAGDSSAPPASQ